MAELKHSYTSTGEKFKHHRKAMEGLRAGHGQRCVTTHLLPTNHCQDFCGFCSVMTRNAADALPLDDMRAYLGVLVKFGLKSVIISGGGNPLLFVCPKTGAKFDDLVTMIHDFGLEIGLITNGLPTKLDAGGRRVWTRCSAASMDAITWIRISMAGIDHKRGVVEVPEVDPAKTTLGFSYVLADKYRCPEEPNHGQVSTVLDLLRYAGPLTDAEIEERKTPEASEEKLGAVFREYMDSYSPVYIRTLPNCLEPARIPLRAEKLRRVANAVDSRVLFSQEKPPSPADHCFLGYLHPVLNSDGFVYPCDSVVLNEEADHQFAEAWRMCHWSEVEKLFTEPVRSLIDDPKTKCPGCVFGGSNRLLEGVVNGSVDVTPSGDVPTHVNFV